MTNFTDSTRQETRLGSKRVRITDKEYVDVETKFVEYFSKGKLDEIEVETVETKYNTNNRRQGTLTFQSHRHMREFAEMLIMYADKYNLKEVPMEAE